VDAVDHFSQQGFIQFLAIEPIEAGGGNAVIRLTPKPEHLNHNGTVNAAVLYGLAEVAGAGAAVADMLDVAAQSYTVVKRATIEYLAPGRGVLDATGRVDKAVVEGAKRPYLPGRQLRSTCPCQ
jgi:acyl-coenzyme A thioesterase PaaI-like protein